MSNFYNLVEKPVNKAITKGWTFKLQREHTEEMLPLIGRDADVSQSQVHVRLSGASIKYCCFDDAQLENTKAINPVIHKCSIGIS